MLPPTSATLWREYAAAPDVHRNIPNCSYAGYRAGEASIPEPPVVAEVRACGAVGDGVADDTPAFEAALERARRAGGGTVWVSPGRYRLLRPLRLDRSGLVLRGAGRERTTLFCERPLAETVAGGIGRDGVSRWSWSGGMVWIGPPEDWLAPEPSVAHEPAPFSPLPQDMMEAVAADGLPRFAPEGWLASGDGRPVAGTARRGESVVRVPDTAGLRPGMTLLVTWENPPDHSLLCFLAGHERMRSYPWESMGRMAGWRWQWPVRVATVTADTVTFAQPLRVDIRPAWRVRLAPLGSHVTECGVEGLTVEFPPHERRSHCRDAGFNGLYFSRCLDGWARDIAVAGADNAINLSVAKQVTVRDFVLRGGPHHHGTSTRVFSHDNLFTDFRIESEPFHGLNVEGFSSGNVWRRGVMRHGTFDFHRGLSYENLRTDIELPNDGRPGGADSAGPRLGARCVHWNIRVTRRDTCAPSMPGCRPFPQAPGAFVCQPDLVSDGALVGVQGIEPCLDAAIEPWGFPAMVPGDKNCIVADHGRVPEPPDLYQAQLDLRLEGRKE